MQFPLRCDLCLPAGLSEADGSRVFYVVRNLYGSQYNYRDVSCGQSIYLGMTHTHTMLLVIERWCPEMDEKGRETQRDTETEGERKTERNEW